MTRIGQYDTDGWELAFDFRIDEASMLLNKWQRMHWAERARYTDRWTWLVLAEIEHRPQYPLPTAWLHVERGSFGVLPDPDGLLGGLKPLLDILTLPRGNKKHGLGVIQDDSPQHLRRLTAQAVRAPRGGGFTRASIYRNAAIQEAVNGG